MPDAGRVLELKVSDEVDWSQLSWVEDCPDTGDPVNL